LFPPLALEIPANGTISGGGGNRTRETFPPLRFASKGYAMRREVEAAIARRDGSHACFYCGRSADSLDHVTARLHGGSDGIDNLVLCCWPCNDEKNTTPGWLFVVRKCWDYVWPDPVVRPLPHYEFTPTDLARMAAVA
jgi:hypothetical protein